MCTQPLPSFNFIQALAVNGAQRRADTLGPGRGTEVCGCVGGEACKAGMPRGKAGRQPTPAAAAREPPSASERPPRRRAVGRGADDVCDGDLVRRRHKGARQAVRCPLQAARQVERCPLQVLTAGVSSAPEALSQHRRPQHQGTAQDRRRHPAHGIVCMGGDGRQGLASSGRKHGWQQKPAFSAVLPLANGTHAALKHCSCCPRLQELRGALRLGGPDTASPRERLGRTAAVPRLLALTAGRGWRGAPVASACAAKPPACVPLPPLSEPPSMLPNDNNQAVVPRPSSSALTMVGSFGGLWGNRGLTQAIGNCARLFHTPRALSRDLHTSPVALMAAPAPVART